MINDKDWPRTLENIRDYLASMLGAKGVPLAYMTRNEGVVPTAVGDPEDGYLKVEKEMIHRAPHSGPTFRNDKSAVWDIMSNICRQHECWIYIKPA
jgi:hypothetical protein